MNISHDRNPLKSPTYTRKKIEHYSYGLADIIGKGYSSQVYKGKHDENNIPVAVKVIDLNMLKNQINRKLLDSQIQILKQLKNKSNILALHDVYTTKNNTYLITELCSSDMNKLVKNKITEPEAYFYMAQLLQGYRHMHFKQIVHRDLKPANLLLTQQKQLKIADFGFSIKMKELSRPSKYNVGSPLYMAPESLKRNQYSYKSDIWAIGVIFYEMLTGDTPWRARTQKQLLKKIENDSIGKVLYDKQFSKMTIEFLSRTLCVDKQRRMSPEEICHYDFKSQSLGSTVSQRRLNQILNRNERYTSVNNTEFLSPKNIFNRSIDKQLFKANRSERNINLNFDKNSSEKVLIKKQHQTLKEIKQNQQLKVKNPQNMEPKDKKTISKVLISLIHMCRFLFKLLGRIRQSQSEGILNKIGCFEVQGIKFGYTRVIKYLIQLLRQFPKRNFLDIENYQDYKTTTDYTKLIKIFNEYYERYSNQLKAFWNQDNFDSNSERNIFSFTQTTQLIEIMVNYCDQISAGFKDPIQDVRLINKDVIIIDYLMTAKQLLDMLKKGGNNFFLFAKKSRIEDIVEGSTAQITYELFQKILFKSKNLLNSKSGDTSDFKKQQDENKVMKQMLQTHINKCVRSPRNRSQRCLLVGHNRSGKKLLF